MKLSGNCTQTKCACESGTGIKHDVIFNCNE